MVRIADGRRTSPTEGAIERGSVLMTMDPNQDRRISLSVAMCTYNGESYLPEQLRSIAAQTRLADALVICDDHSTDRTAAMVTEFAEYVSFPVRLHVNPQTLGSTKNFEKAIRFCSGDF